jgi:hypothetical protein
VKQQRSWPLALQRTILIAFWSLPALFASYIVWKHGVPVPFWDEWNTPGAQIASWYRGTLTFAELCSQHNEHRLLFPRLVLVPIAIVAGWDVRHGMLLTLCLAGLGSAGLYRLLRHSGDSGPLRAIIFGMMNVLVFSPRLYETFLVGAQGQTLLPTFALVLALLVNLSDKPLATKTIVIAALAHISTYSFGNGMLVWLLAFPLETAPASKRTRILWRSLYLLFAAASAGSYFISYQHPPLSPPLVSPAGQTLAFLQFVLVWIGSLFSVGAPAVWGAGVLLLFVVMAIVGLRQVRRSGVWRPHYPWLVLGCYTLISGCVAAAARLGFPYSMAGDSRYAAFSVFFYIALLGLAFSVSQHAQNRALMARAATTSAIVCLGLVLALWSVTFKKERRFLRDWTRLKNHSLLVVRWAEAIPQNPEIASLSPYPETPGVIRTLAEHDAFRPRFVSKKLARMVKEVPSPENGSAGILEQTTPDPSGRVVLQGWARLPDRNRPADYVVLGFETADLPWQPFSVSGTGAGRSERFSQTIEMNSLPRAAISIRACAIDLEQERVFPIEGVVPLPRER